MSAYLNQVIDNTIGSEKRKRYRRIMKGPLGLMSDIGVIMSYLISNVIVYSCYYLAYTFYLSVFKIRKILGLSTA